MALILFLTFFLTALVGRIALQYYLTGDHGIRFAARSAPLTQILPGTVFLLSFVCSFVLLVMAETRYLSMEISLPLEVSMFGTVLGFTGVAITIVAQWQMRESWRIGVDNSERTDFVTTGLYARSRNPIYLGILMYWIGMVLNFPHPLMWGCALVSWISIEAVVRCVEEPYLQSLHGSAFDDYVQRTCRYLPC